VSLRSKGSAHFARSAAASGRLPFEDTDKVPRGQASQRHDGSPRLSCRT
jgi:hypothetical protein